MATKIMIDAGHGGTKDPGAVFEDRMGAGLRKTIT